jgi:hypothetical protein
MDSWLQMPSLDLDLSSESPISKAETFWNSVKIAGSKYGTPVWLGTADERLM